jgi:hypothetical protein
MLSASGYQLGLAVPLAMSARVSMQKVTYSELFSRRVS